MYSKLTENKYKCIYKQMQFIDKCFLMSELVFWNKTHQRRLTTGAWESENFEAKEVESFPVNSDWSQNFTRPLKCNTNATSSRRPAHFLRKADFLLNHVFSYVYSSIVHYNFFVYFCFPIYLQYSNPQILTLLRAHPCKLGI